MGKTKQIKKEEVAATPKQSPIILAKYKPIPRMRGCSRCF